MSYFGRFSAVVGVDPSLTATGIATLLTGDEGRRPYIDKVGTKALTVRPGRKVGWWDDRFDRLDRLEALVGEQVPERSLVIYEGPSYGSKGASVHDSAGAWWAIARHLRKERGCAVLVAEPSVRMKYATGKGNADKDWVLAETVKRYPDIEIRNNNTADALLFLAIGLRLLGLPLEGAPMPKTHLAAITTLQADFERLTAAVER